MNVDDNSHLWGEQYNRKLADALAVQQEIAAQISDKLRARLSNEQKTRIAKRQTENPEAYQLYLKGLYYAGQFTQEGLDKGLAFFRQAIALDPTYVLPYHGISYDYSLLDDTYMAPDDTMPKAKEAAEKALELDEMAPDAHVDLGNIHCIYDFDWAAAEKEFKRAIELNMNSAYAHELYGWCLTMMGRFEEAIKEGRRSEALDPLSVESSSVVGWDLYYARRYDEAVTELRKAIDLAPDYWPLYFYMGQAYQGQRRFDDAIASFKKAQALESHTAWPRAELAHAYAPSGRAPEARQMLQELLARRQPGYLSSYLIALISAALGDRSQALTELEQAYTERSILVTYLKVDPALDSLRSEPRFQDLVRRMNFPQ